MIKNMRTCLCTFLILVCTVLSQKAEAKEKIIWTLNNLIPFYIQDGPYKGQGISDKLTVFFQKHLPEYEHHQEDMSFSRFFALAERGTLVCNPLLLKTPDRQKILHYSTAFKPAYTHVLVSNYAVVYPPSGVSLDEFLEKDKHPFILQNKRSYGPIMDKIIKKWRANGRFGNYNFSTKQLFIMLENGRIDHFLDIENTVTYYRKLHSGKKKIFNIPLVEDRLDRFGYAVCSKTIKGKILIDKINQIIEREKASKEFREIIESWMAPENLQRFRTFYDREILGLK